MVLMAVLALCEAAYVCPRYSGSFFVLSYFKCCELHIAEKKCSPTLVVNVRYNLQTVYMYTRKLLGKSVALFGQCFMWTFGFIHCACSVTSEQSAWPNILLGGGCRLLDFGFHPSIFVLLSTFPVNV